ncbi:MAG: PxKF domain-containing protein [Acidimicrobiia bacterium]
MTLTGSPGSARCSSAAPLPFISAVCIPRGDGDQSLRLRQLLAAQLQQPTECQGRRAARVVAGPGGTSLNYDAASGEYSFVWKTEKAWANSCRYLVVGLADGSVHNVLIQFKK